MTIIHKGEHQWDTWHASAGLLPPFYNVWRRVRCHGQSGRLCHGASRYCIPSWHKTERAKAYTAPDIRERKYNIQQKETVSVYIQKTYLEKLTSSSSNNHTTRLWEILCPITFDHTGILLFICSRPCQMSSLNHLPHCPTKDFLTNVIYHTITSFVITSHVVFRDNLLDAWWPEIKAITVISSLKQ